MSHHNKNHLPYVTPYYVIICKYTTLSITYSSLNAIVAQLKICPLGVDTTIELKNMTTTSDNNDG
jgi:hypothetical protein